MSKNTMSKDTMSPERLIAVVANVLAILGSIWAAMATTNQWIDTLKLPTTFNFYFLAFWALVAAGAGGLIWNFSNRYILKKETIGGEVEPSGWEAIAWSFSTNLCIVVALVILNLIYHFAPIPYQLLLYCAFLIGAMIGSLLFYGGLPYWRNRQLGGLRKYIYSKPWSDAFKELVLVVLWSLLISGLGFLAMGLTKRLVTGISDLVTPIIQIGFCVELTTLAVLFFLVAFTDQTKFESARGIIAGLALRMTLFFGVLLGTGLVSIHWW